jgi:hypothetical protein
MIQIQFLNFLIGIPAKEFSMLTLTRRRSGLLDMQLTEV